MSTTTKPKIQSTSQQMRFALSLISDMARVTEYNAAQPLLSKYEARFSKHNKQSGIIGLAIIQQEGFIADWTDAARPNPDSAERVEQFGAWAFVVEGATDESIVEISVRLLDRAMSKLLEATHENFYESVRNIARCANMTTVSVFWLWKEYAKRCENADQSATLAEFVRWYQNQLGGNAAALSDAACAPALFSSLH